MDAGSSGDVVAGARAGAGRPPGNTREPAKSSYIGSGWSTVCGSGVDKRGAERVSREALGYAREPISSLKGSYKFATAEISIVERPIF